MTQVASAKGDYRATSYDAWSVVGPVLSALRSAAITWVRARCAHDCPMSDPDSDPEPWIHPHPAITSNMQLVSHLSCSRRLLRGRFALYYA